MNICSSYSRESYKKKNFIIFVISDDMQVNPCETLHIIWVDINNATAFTFQLLKPNKVEKDL